MDQKTYFLCGIGGSGMTPLAYVLKQKGHRVLGSDRSYDQGKLSAKFDAFKKFGIEIVPQDGSGISKDIDFLVVSSAVEDRIPDVKAAKKQNVTIKKRAEILAELFNQEEGIAVAGTSGKTTVTAMIGHVLKELGAAPTIINGGAMLNFQHQGEPQPYHVGKGDVFVTETDESDASILYFNPEIGVLNNVADDHKPMNELIDIFSQYIKNCQKDIVINKDNVVCRKLIDTYPNHSFVQFSLKDDGADLYADGIEFKPQGTTSIFYDRKDNKKYTLCLNVPGAHNIYNALACLGAVKAKGLDIEEAVKALETFKGTRRRLEIVGEAKNVIVYDDFAHNPDKIAASLSTLSEFEGRLIVMYQPHGFGPTKMLEDQLVESFSSGLSEKDILVMPEIYYAGGTVERSISSEDITDAVAQNNRQTAFFETRDECGQFILENAKPGDRIVIMGARDDTLTLFAREILDGLSDQDAALA